MADLIKNSPQAIRDFADAAQIATYGGVIEGGQLRQVEMDGKLRASETMRTAIRAYISQGAKDAEAAMAREVVDTKKIRAFMTKDSLPEVITSSFSTFMQTDNYDMKWQMAYATQPIEPTRNFWEIVDISNGLTFQDVPEGGKLNIYGMSGSKLVCFVHKYGGALGWTDEMIRFRNVAAMLNTAKAFQDKFWADKANRHYKLLSTAYGNSTSGNVTSYDSTGSTVVDKDINTINSAVVTVMRRLKDAGYGDLTEANYLLYYPPEMASRLIRALAYVGQDGIPGAPTRVNWNVTLLRTLNRYMQTPNGNTNDNYCLLVLPGQKIQNATVMDPTSFYDEDVQSLTYIQTVWSYYGAAVGDTRQVQLVKFT